MADASETGVWSCRAGVLFTRMFSFALALLVVLAGVFAALFGDQLLWLPAAVVAGIWVGFKGAPLLLRGLERAGLFSRVRLSDGRLTLGRSSRTVDLSEPFEAEARSVESRIEREYDLRDFRLGGFRRPGGHAIRKHVLLVKVLTVTIQQGGRRFDLVADETNFRPGPEYDLEGLGVRRVPISPPASRALRLWGAHLAEVLAVLQAAPGFSPSLLPRPEKAPEDPRKTLCPTWKTVLGASAVLLAFGAGAVAAYLDAEERRGARVAARMEAADRERRDREGRAGALVGKRVSVDARRGVRMVGTVKSFEMVAESVYEPDHRIVWHARLEVEVDHLLDAGGEVLPADSEIPYRHAGDIVRRGSLLEVDLEEVEEVSR
jgi:hypothetical protein